MKHYNCRYIISYLDKKQSGVYLTGIKKHDYKSELFETDDLSEFNEMLELIKTTCAGRIVAIDTLSKKILYVRLSDYEHDFSEVSQRKKWELLEELLGDNKTIEDFKDPALVARDKMRRENDPRHYSWVWSRSERDADAKYSKYLKEHWGRSKQPKNRPELKVEDDPHMPKIEVDALKQADKEKLQTIVERCGW